MVLAVAAFLRDCDFENMCAPTRECACVHECVVLSLLLR